MSLDLEHITVRFGGLVALDDVSLDVGDGMITGLIGPNGAGKTTLFNVASGVNRDHHGTVVLNGDRVERRPVHVRARAGLGRTFQRLELFGSLSVRDNIRVAVSGGSKASRAGVVDELLERVGLVDVAESRADAVSTGTGRRVELARCLATRPSVILMDEPASGQNDDETAHFATILRSLAADGIAVLLVEHDMDLVMEVCSRVHVLDFGRRIASGTPDEISRDPAVIAAYLGTEV